MREQKSHNEPLPKSELGQQFCHYFNCGKYFIYKSNNRWYTETRFPLTPRTLWRRYQDTSQVIGIRFDNQTNFFVLDIDVNSRYHYKYDPYGFFGILECLTDIGINKVIKLKSSTREGIHLFGFLPQKIKTFNLACALEKVLTTNGFVIKPGQLEIFPNPKPYNPTGEKSCGFNGIRLPLQEGTGAKLYNQKMRLVNGGIKKFLRLANQSTKEQNMGILKRYANRAVKWHKEQKTTNYQQQRRENYRRDMEVAAFTGWSDRGETNEILKSITNYGWVIEELRTWEKLAEYIEKTAISLPGYKQFCQHKQEIKLRAKHWAKSGCRYWSHKWSYPARKGKTYIQLHQEVSQSINAELKLNQPTSTHRYSYINEKRQSEFINRLKTCIQTIGINNLPKKVGECIEILRKTSQKLFGCKFSLKTLKKPENRRLWHIKYRPHKLPSAPFVKLDALNVIAIYLQQVACTLLVKNSSILHEKKHSDISIQNKSPHKAVVQTIKTSKITTQNPSNTSFLEKDPTMKCFLLQLQVRLEVRLWVSSIISKLYKNELEKTSSQINQDTSNSIDQVEYKSLSLPSESQVKTSEMKFQEIKKARKKNSYFYHGIEVNSRSALTRRHDELENLKPGMKIRILTNFHSSTLGDDDRQILVYVRPTEIKTKEKYLVPLERLVPVLDHENYNSALLPFVKKLVISLGLNKVDYHDYLRKTYQVCRTQDLTGTQIFQIIKYYESLLIE